MGREYRRRVQPKRAQHVRERLKEARLRRDMSLGETARRIQVERRRLARERREGGEEVRGSQITHRTDVRRFEGGDPSRQPAPPVEYVEAAATVFDVKPRWLLAEDDPQWQAPIGRKLLKQELPDHIAEQLEQESRIRHILRLSSGLPYTPGVAFDREELQGAHEALERLFWRAFGRRGLSFKQLLFLARELGRNIVTPPQLPSDGFRTVAELSPEEYRRFWTLQLLALEAVLRPEPQPSDSERDLERLWEHQQPWRAVAWEESTLSWSRAESTNLTLHAARESSWEEALSQLAAEPTSTELSMKAIARILA